jgi:hypothetical protein
LPGKSNFYEEWHGSWDLYQLSAEPTKMKKSMSNKNWDGDKFLSYIVFPDGHAEHQQGSDYGQGRATGVGQVAGQGFGASTPIAHYEFEYDFWGPGVSSDNKAHEFLHFYSGSLDGEEYKFTDGAEVDSDWQWYFSWQINDKY